LSGRAASLRRNLTLEVRYHEYVQIYPGWAVHVVPGEEVRWIVVDFRRRGQGFPSKAAAVEHAKRLAASHPPSQVVLFDAFGRTKTVAHYQLPQYRKDREAETGNRALFAAAVKSVLIDDLVAAGVGVRRELVNSVERDLQRELAKSKGIPKGKRRRRAA